MAKTARKSQEKKSAPRKGRKTAPAAAPTKESRSVIKAKYRERYTTPRDEVAEHLSSFTDGKRIDVKAIREFAERNGCWVERYEELNPGMVRMNVGNRLRAKLRKGEEISW